MSKADKLPVETTLNETAVRLPDFLVIGAPKSGSGSLRNMLLQHPQIRMSTNAEPEFFSVDRNFRRGLDYYKSLFPPATPDQLVGEVTPDYMFAPQAAERIAQTIPQAKFIATLRNPIERAYSMYRMQSQKGSEISTFGKAIRRNPLYVEQGLYYAQLSQFMAHFDRGQLLVVLFDTLKTDFPAYIRQILQFLGVDEEVEIVPKQANFTGTPRHKSIPMMLNVAYRCRNAMRRVGLSWLTDSAAIDDRARWLRNKISRWNLIKTPGEPIRDEDWNFLADRFREDCEKLSEYIDQDVTGWLKKKESKPASAETHP